MSAAVDEFLPQGRLLDLDSAGATPGQKRTLTAVFHDNRRNVAMVGGIGAGKTRLLAILATMLSYENPPGVPGMVVAPTFGMLRDVDEVALEEFWQENGIPYIPRRAEHSFFLTEAGNWIYCRSCDNPSRIRGPNVGWVIGDEIAQWDDRETHPSNSAVNISLGRVRHPKAKRHVFAVVGTPNGFDHLYARFAEVGGKRLLPDAWITRAPTWENHHLPPTYVPELKLAYDPTLYEQEVEGRFVNVAGGRTYYAFDREKNAAQSLLVDLSLPIILCCDFNVTPMSWVVAQCRGPGRPIRVIDEISIDGTSTKAACDEFVNRWGGHAAGYRVYGDATGRAKDSTSGKSDWEIIREELKTIPYVRAKNPDRKDRYAAVNARLRNKAGQVSLFIDRDRCPRLIKDFEQARFKPGTFEVDDSDKTIGHMSDALGYYIADEHPIVAGRIT